MPLGAKILLAIVIVGAILLIALVTRSNRKRQMGPRGMGAFDWIGEVGRSAVCTVTEASLEQSQLAPVVLCVQALRNIGVIDIESSDDIVGGWLNTGSAMKLSSWVPQQVGIRIQVKPDGQIRFDCCSRPQFSVTLSDFGRSLAVANLLAKEIALLATDSASPS